MTCSDYIGVRSCPSEFPANSICMIDVSHFVKRAILSNSCADPSTSKDCSHRVPLRDRKQRRACLGSVVHHTQAANHARPLPCAAQTKICDPNTKTNLDMLSQIFSLTFSVFPSSKNAIFVVLCTRRMGVEGTTAIISAAMECAHGKLNGIHAVEVEDVSSSVIMNAGQHVAYKQPRRHALLRSDS